MVQSNAVARHSSYWLAFRLVVLGGLIGLACGSPLRAVDFPLRWRWSNPSPHGNNVVDMSFSPVLNLAVQVTELGQLYTSSDLRLWTPRDSGTSLNLRGVAFFGNNPPRIVVTGENGTVLYADSVETFQSGTLLDGPTTSWLEAVASSPAQVVAVGDAGAIYTSVDGAAWKRQAAPSPSSTWLRGLAHGSGMFVAVGDSGYVIRSSDGTNWVKVNAGTSTHLNRVSYGAGQFTLVGQGGLVMTSTNLGVSWNVAASGAIGDLYHSAHGFGVRLVLGQEEVRLEEWGLWMDELAKTNGPPVWTYLANIQRSDYFLIAGRTGLMAEGFKTNGSPYFWLETDLSIRHLLFDMIYATNLYVAVGDRASVLTSGNGIDWNLEFVPPSVTNSIFLGVGGSTNLLVAAGNAGSLMVSPNIITNLTVPITNGTGGIEVSNVVVSSLGVLWFAIEPRPTSNDIQGVAYGNGLYVVTGDEGFVMTSPDGTNWTERITPTSRLLSSVAWNGSVFVASGDDGVMISSPDGAQWDFADSKTANWLYKVRWLDGIFVAVGQNGTIRTSVDGLSWQARTSGTTAWLNDVTHIDDTFFVVGTQGTILSSSNAVDWTGRGAITKKSLYSAATDGAYLLVAGVEGVILRSPVAPDPTPVRILDYARVASESFPEIVQNIYLFAGQPDQQFTLDRTQDISTNGWATGPQLEFFSSDGTLFYLENILTSKSPAEEYYEATIHAP